jgi:hypothetical protein
LAIKNIDLNGLNISALDTAQINAVAVWVRARGIKGFNAADFTKGMFRTAGIECVGRDHIFTADQTESRGRNNHLIAAAFITDRAVAGMSVQMGRCIDFKLNCAAVASAFMGFEFGHSLYPSNYYAWVDYKYCFEKMGFLFLVLELVR